MMQKLKFNQDQPIIFITNDDSVYSKGISELIKAMAHLGQVVVVAPDIVRSGSSSAITHGVGLELNLLKQEDNLHVFSCSGTPVDCVKLAFFALFDKQLPTIVLSGINHGSNASVNSLYSATVGAAIEGCVNNISSIAFSLCDHDDNADFSNTIEHVVFLVERVLKNPLPNGTFLNVNFPKGKILGLKSVRQADARWSEEYDVTKKENGTKYWLAGYFDNREPQALDTDEWALGNGYGSVVPVKIDMTDYDWLNKNKF